MPAQTTRADSLREYLSGAGTDGGVQTNPNNSLGNYRSATEAASYGITIGTPITGVSILYAGGGNPQGTGVLTAIDSSHLTWQPAGALTPGVPEPFSNGETRVVEALSQPGQYLRITATTPFSIGSSTVALNYLVNNFFGFDDVTFPTALSGVSEYRATIVRNESTGLINAFNRWIATLGTQQVSDIGNLGASGAGTISTSGSFADWPAAGWCQIQSSGGTLKEVVYYTSRTLTVLTVPPTGRALLGTTVTGGSSTDLIFSVPGIALAIDPNGVQNFGNFIQGLPNANTPPASVTWNLGLTLGTGLDIGNMGVAQQVGLWEWRQIPSGSVATPLVLNQTLDSFGGF